MATRSRAICNPYGSHVFHSPTLDLPNFNDKFIIEIDASSTGMGVVLVQKGHPLAFASKALDGRKTLSAYKWELMAIIFTIK